MKTLTGVLIAAIYISVTSCATIVSGSKQKLEVNSFPDGATIVINGYEKGKTPRTLKINRRKHLGTITLRKEGYEDHHIPTYQETNPWVWGNIVSWGILGLGIDAATGAIHRITPNFIDAQLRRKEDNR